MEDRIGSQGMWRLKEICSENLELMNAGIILRNNGKLPIFYKRNLDSNIECCTIMLTEPTTPLIFMRNPVGLFICGLFYVSVSKTIINNKQGDLYQVLEYARKRDIQDVYLLYPMYRYEEKEKEFPVAVSESPSGDINVHFIRMPFIFEEDEDRTRQQLTDVIKVVFSIQKDHYYE